MREETDREIELRIENEDLREENERLKKTIEDTLGGQCGGSGQ